MLGDIIPYMEKNYRVNGGRSHRALGGPGTLDIGLTNMRKANSLDVFNSAWFLPTREKSDKKLLKDPRTKGKLKSFWIARRMRNRSQEHWSRV